MSVDGFAGALGPDLTAQGFSQCGGIAAANYSSVMGDDFYSLCEGYDEILFACSTNDDDVAEYTSASFSLTGVTLSDATCDTWTGAANSPYSTDHILSIDPTVTVCSQYNVSFDMYVHFGTQWGCNGVTNTHSTGGRMWAYVK